MELKDWAKLGAMLTVMLGSTCLVLWNVSRSIEATVASIGQKVSAPELNECRTANRAEVKRAHAAEVDQLKARLAVASCDRRAANLEDALKRERGTK